MFVALRAAQGREPRCDPMSKVRKITHSHLTGRRSSARAPRPARRRGRAPGTTDNSSAFLRLVVLPIP
jgi:hypothetical protein